MVSSTDGASTFTFWKRRSSALSFSMYLRYSLSVVAPMHCSSPRESAGLKMFDASIAPSAAPAPTIVCSSSMKMMTFFERLISSITALMRSSNWPRYLVPATISARSRVMTFLSARISGTLPLAISCARPSTMAVLPTPASPTSTGLFLVRRQRIWMTRLISFLRPMTGSISPLRASSVRSRPNAFSAGVLTSFLSSGLLPRGATSSPPPATLLAAGLSPWPEENWGSSSRKISLRVRSMSTSSVLSTRAATPSPSRSRPSRMCSVPT